MNKSIYSKINEVQANIGKIVKAQSNPFFKSHYFDINQLLEQLMPLILEQGMTLIQPLTHVDGKPALKTIIADDEGGIEFVCPLPENIDPQKMGSTITYFRRYSLQSLFCLQAEDDDGNAASTPAITQKASSKPRTKEEGIFTELKGKIQAENDFGKLEQFKASLMNSPNVVTSAHFKDLIALIEAKVKRSNLKETKQESRNTAELDITAEETTIQINES
jgi:hypothetical protein